LQIAAVTAAYPCLLIVFVLHLQIAHDC
jgi:hypothetical protein